MAVSPALARCTDTGIHHVLDLPQRLGAAREMLRAMAGDSREARLTMGEFDLVFAYEASDDAVAARSMLLHGRQGYLRTGSLKAFPEAACREIICALRLRRPGAGPVRPSAACPCTGHRPT